MFGNLTILKLKFCWSSLGQPSRQWLGKELSKLKFSVVRWLKTESWNGGQRTADGIGFGTDLIQKANLGSWHSSLHSQYGDTGSEWSTDYSGSGRKKAVCFPLVCSLCPWHGKKEGKNLTQTVWERSMWRKYLDKKLPLLIPFKSTSFLRNKSLTVYNFARCFLYEHFNLWVRETS